MQPYPWSPGNVWPGHLHGTGCWVDRCQGVSGPPTRRGAMCKHGVRLGFLPTLKCLGLSIEGYGRKFHAWV